METVRIPADIDREDRILGGLTARQLAIVAVTAVVLWAAWTATRGLLPAAVLAGLAAPVALAAGGLVVGRRDGLTGDRLAVAAWRHHRAPKRQVLAPGGVATPPAWLAAAAAGDQTLPTPLKLPTHGVDGGGVVDLGPDGSALICRASSPSFGLRTPEEQQALIAAFGRWLNSLAGGVQVVVRAERADLRPAVAALVDAAPGLPHPALETAACEHADFLASLATRRDVLARHVLVVFHDPAPADAAAPALERRAADATAALAAADVTLVVLDSPDASAVLTRATDPHGPDRPGGLSTSDHIITGAA